MPAAKPMQVFCCFLWTAASSFIKLSTALISMPSLKFSILPVKTYPSDLARDEAFLRIDYWDDWGKYRTQYDLCIVDSTGDRHEIGEVKIGQRGLRPHSSGVTIPQGSRTPALEASFEQLDDRFFSLGQSDDYYENLKKLGDALRERILTALRDIAFSQEIWSVVKTEDVTTESLLRSVTATAVEGQLRRIASGGAKLTRYSFSFTPIKRRGEDGLPPTLHFNVDPNWKPSTNVHVLIGRNGVGKTSLLASMTETLVNQGAARRSSETFQWNNTLDNTTGFSNLVTVSFSAFDDTELLPEGRPQRGGLKYSYIGLRRKSKNSTIIRPKSVRVLSTEFISSLTACQIEPARRRWIKAIQFLETDPVFHTANAVEMIEANLNSEEGKTQTYKTFKRFSSGHKIVLLTLTRLVETVEEKTLILIDEPEAHLHPPLLAAFIRALSDLLVDRNGVAIIATHSPVILQEVPRICVWIIQRILGESKVDRPSIETFGENVGILSREVFQLELSQSGFQNILSEAAQEYDTYELAVDAFQNQLGAEAKAVLRALYAAKDNSQF